MGDHFLLDSILGEQGIQGIHVDRSSFKVFCLSWSISSSRWFWAIPSGQLRPIGSQGLVPRRVLALVGDFRRAKDSSFWLGRTGLTGRMDRSDR